MLVVALAPQAKATQLIPPEPPGDAQMPQQTEDFSAGAWELLEDALGALRPDWKQACQTSLAVSAAALLMALLRYGKTGTLVNLAGTGVLAAAMLGSTKAMIRLGTDTVRQLSDYGKLLFPVMTSGTLVNLAGTGVLAAAMLGSTKAMIRLGTDTVRQLSDYGKLLFPVMTSALAAQGGVTSSAALYAGTALLDAVLSSLISSLLIPMVYLFLALAIANSALGEDLLKRLRDLIRSTLSWCLKILLTVFTTYMSITGVVSGTTDAAALKAAKLTISSVVPVVGGILADAKILLTVFTTYMSITGVVSGTTDAAALKAAKLTISSVVPVVGGILADASESVLVGAELVKNAAGIYGILAILAVFLEPFLRIGVHYLLLKATAAICSVFGSGAGLIEDFSAAMGLLLAMTGAVCLMMLISTVCFLKGVG